MNWIKQQAANIAGTAEPIYGPSALRSVAEQTSKTPWTELKKEDLAWAAMDSTCVETQTFYLFADSGHVGLAQVIYSNVAGIRTTCQFNSKVFHPPGSGKPHLWCSDALEHADFGADKLCFVADGCAVTLSEDGASYAVKSARNEKCLVDVTVARAAPGFQAGADGTSHFGSDPENPWGSMRHVFWPRCEVSGGFATADGRVEFQRGMFVHALQGMKPHHAAARWNFLNFQSPTHSAVLMEYTTPPSYGSSRVTVGAVARDGAIVCAGASPPVTHTATREDPDWPEPRTARFQWAGKDAAGKEVSAELEGELGERTDKMDVLAEVPGFVKAIVGGVVGTRPFIYQYYPEKGLELSLKVGGEETREVGKVFMESTFISE